MRESLRSTVGNGLVQGFLSYYLLAEHREHMALALPYLFLLACPLSHLLGHHHGPGGSDRQDGQK